MREGLYNERRDISPYKSTESTSSVGDDVAEIVAAGSANQDEAESTAAEEDPELENYEAPLTTKLQHLAGTLRAWTTRLTTEDALSTFLESTFWIWTQPISWFFASLFYISRRVFSKITLLWILTVFVGLVSVAVYGWVASVHASVYGWAGFILHIGPWSICKASMGNFFQTACYPEDITADVLNTFNKTYVNFDTAIATRNLISTAPIDLRNNRNSVYRDLLRLRALNVTHDVPNANFASIDSQTVIVLDLTKTIPDLLFRYLSRLASTMAVVDYQTNVTITEIASFRDGKKSSYISIPGERPYRVNAQQAVSIRFKAHVLSWQKLMKPLSEVGQALLDAIGASIDPIEGLSVSLETASSATYDSRVNIHSEWGLAKRSVYWLTGEEPAETKPLLQTRSVIGEMNGTLHHLLTWFGPMWANILSVNLGLDEILRAVDGGGILVLREGEGLELLNEMLVVFNEASARMGEGKRGLEATKMIRNFREK